MSARTDFSSASSTRRSPTSGPVSYAERISVPSAPATAGGTSTGVSGAVGKSMVIAPSASAVVVSTPLRVRKRTVPVAVPVVCSTCAVAKVAWPHMFTSAAGVSQRSAQSASPPSGSGCAKAVSERLTSVATCWSQAVSGKAPESRSTTPAGLPVNGRSLKASTIRILMAVSVEVPQGRGPRPIRGNWTWSGGLVGATGGAGRADAAFPVTCAGDGCTAAWRHGGTAEWLSCVGKPVTGPIRNGEARLPSHG